MPDYIEFENWPLGSEHMHFLDNWNNLEIYEFYMKLKFKNPKTTDTALSDTARSGVSGENCEALPAA